MSAIALLTDAHNYYLYTGHADMRKSIDGLCGIVQNELGRQTNPRDVFVFLNRRCTHIELLLQEADGFTLLYRRLHKGRFTMPPAGDQQAAQLSTMELMSLLSGLQLHTTRRKP